jgi:phosphoribosylaminoimidazolecarboxamide formyltransferase/IMP cyclohydrolase
MSPSRKPRRSRTERSQVPDAPDKRRSKRRALLSVADKQGLAPFALALERLGFEIVSTGGTAKALRAAGIIVTDVATVTGFPEIMDGRVKTLHPHIHGGLLARRGIDDAVLESHGIGVIDLLVVNLYPFEATTARADCTDAEAIENIDVGGPAMLRAAAKNHEHIVVVVEHSDYATVLTALEGGEVPAAIRRELAIKAFSHTARYDTAISEYLRARSGAPAEWANPLLRSWSLDQPLRYGENPHQRAALYRTSERVPGTVAHAQKLQGKELSFNNLVDADAAYQAVKAFETAACVIVKHASPCGIATAASPVAAYQLAYRADPTSAFGGVLAFNRALDQPSAQAIVAQQFAEVIIAPEVDKEARAVLAQKPGIRVLEAGWPAPTSAAGNAGFELKTIEGGLLVQSADDGRVDVATTAKVVTQRQPTANELRDLAFAWTVVKYVKSNAIVLAREGATIGIGAGQPSRVMSARIAALKAEEAKLDVAGAALASDAFFPFRDGIDAAAERGVLAVVQPGGSVRDDEVVRAADEHGMTMLFTGMRHFRH